jgi:hypothetical protein
MAQRETDNGVRHEPDHVKPDNVEPDNIETPPPYREGQQQFITGDTGRQGPSGIRVLIVLGVSLLLTMIVWGVVAEFGY